MFISLSILLQKTSGLVVVLVSSLLAYQFALFTWFLLPEEMPSYQWTAPMMKTGAKDNKIGTKKLQQQHLFGELAKVENTVKKVVTVKELPKTKLNLNLVGVVAATEPSSSSAIVAYQNKQDSYFIGSKIDGTNALVSEIYEDRIIIDVDGESQTLMLDGVDQLSKQRAIHEAQAPAAFVESDDNDEVSTVELDREALLKDPGKLTDYIYISPVREGGDVKGYRVKAGKDSSLFEQAGLKDGDLAIALNGIDLTDTQQAFSLMKEFPTMTEMSLTVERDGQLHDLYLRIP
ncbi:type II secretion system protein GspC [Psychromonas antarctica]|uniref:type II secretion system protein GspC n=1 Tax=Psychromonas antarctica TaxID=67573 RepID=UPI001EE8F9FC|nr:type II secretion system protein GspC [Psychromonas antarctica]MCG6200103.1 type II secretion system protein GspC [Psychromonas antarctica]